MVTLERDQQKTRLILEPNRSATWHESKWLIVGMMVILITIALGWIFAGVWMILPFAGLETGLFALLTYLVSRQTYRQQIITMTPSEITVENKLGARSRSDVFSRYGCTIDFVETEDDWLLPALFLSAQKLDQQVTDGVNEISASLEYGTPDNSYESQREDWERYQRDIEYDQSHLEIGSFLNLDDRKKLKKLLQSEGIPLSRTFWWRTN